MVHGQPKSGHDSYTKKKTSQNDPESATVARLV